MHSIDMIYILIFCIGWVIIGTFVLKKYKGRDEKPRLYKVMIVLLVGLFSFTFNFNLLNHFVSISILPLGVWMVYFFTRKGQWKSYRYYAWLGFFANYLFMLLLLANAGLHSLVYPKSSPTTFVASTEKPYLLESHSTAKEVSLKDDFVTIISTFKQGSHDVEEWYYVHVNDEKMKDEQFPYILTGTYSKFGSSLKPMIYVEKSGKGILVLTDGKQQYFEGQRSIFESEVEGRE
ncbi:hypothetical protein [Cytobacillus purgationiresistens]|uniref:Uncharacterized protein n=1 Tax=Cytobacillus purgationiresistens TaxID=863449 RepID=A0ABU0AAM7_9BACI|nr:hypothetical protein [Cytobacillus purgationiresistens]MDQ0268303.1 hypothetical protein [Cytobacillus purgationiresistens]